MKYLLICFFVFSLFSTVDAQPVHNGFDTLFDASRPVVKLAANPQLKGGRFKDFFLGKNYRAAWTTPISVPILDMKHDLGGLTIKKLGGGKQTHSLHTEDEKGRSVFLRSVRKYPEKALPPELTHTIAEKIVVNEISASYPYGVLSMGPLSDAAGVPYLKNKLTYLPESPSLKDEYSDLSDALYLMELRYSTNDGEEVKTFSTDEMVQKLQESGKNRIDQAALLRERLLDNFIMDFDRHEGQYDWGKKDSAGFSFFYPIPKDRDQAFFKSEGFLPSALSKMQAFHQLQGLRPQTKHIATFNFAARNLDRAFLIAPDKKTWSDAIDRFLYSMSDDVIEKAMVEQPKEIQQYGAQKIAEILKKKRQYFKKDLLNYYDALAERVTVTGTNEWEQFDVSDNADGSLHITVHHLEKNGKLSYQIYQRDFYPDETKEVQLYGLEGDDRFIIHGNAAEIKIRLIGGPGDDQFVNESKSDKIWLYDVSYENNKAEGNKIHQRISSDPLNNEYRRLGFGFDSNSPRLVVDYSRDGGLFLGLGYLMIRHGFRKEPYSSRQFASVSRAINSSSYLINYNGTFIKLVRNEDLLLRGDLQLPTSRTRFYGYGNNTVNKYAEGEGEYYLASYIKADVSALLQHHFTSWLQMQYGPVAQFLKLSEERNEGKYINAILPSDRGEEGLSGGKWYAGAQVSAQINARNNELFTTRGAAVDVYAKRLQDLTAHTGGFTEVGASASFYTDFLYKKHVVLATSFGAAHNIGTFSFPQAQYLGFKENLRGFRMQRFAGRTRAYNNTELRVNFGTLNLYLLKGPFGVLGFHDIGRVWTDDETSSVWHRGYGGGLWMAPFNKIVLSGIVTYSKEEKNFVNLNVGFQF